METQQFIRKIQFRQGSLTVTIPREVIRDMDMKRGQYVVITLQEGRLIIDLIPAGGVPDVILNPAVRDWDAKEQADYDTAHDKQGDEPVMEGFRM